MYDYLIAGAGLFGAVFAREMTDKGKRCLVIDRRPHIGGNTFCENTNGINVHKYGAHIFHTKNKRVWEYVNRFAVFNNYVHMPQARYRDTLYNLPFNMHTFTQMWGIKTPQEARDIIAGQIAGLGITQPRNLEEQALSMAGTDIYEKLIRGYTEKQWGRACDKLPASIIKRIPLRFEYNNNYFDDSMQGIPIGGYNPMIEKLLDGSDVRLGVSFADFVKCEDTKEASGIAADRASKATGNLINGTVNINIGSVLNTIARKIIFTGSIDEFFDYKFGKLEYRSVRFETETLGIPDFQSNAVINYTEREIPFTRIIEHKHFEYGTHPRVAGPQSAITREQLQAVGPHGAITQTVISREYPHEWHPGAEPFYPINDEKNNALYRRYLEYADTLRSGNGRPHVIFGGRLGQYKYMDMDEVIESALNIASDEN